MRADRIRWRDETIATVTFAGVSWSTLTSASKVNGLLMADDANDGDNDDQDKERMKVKLMAEGIMM